MNRVEWQVGMTLKDIEKKVIEKSMAHFEGNKLKVAVSLGVSLRTIDNKLSLYKSQGNEETRKDS